MKTITSAIRMVVFGLLSLRGCEYVFHLFSKNFSGGTPCHVVIQNWVLRFGLHKLKQFPEKRNDWVCILDHTIDFGSRKCLVVLGVTLERFRMSMCKLKHSDMEVLAIDITEKADAASVTETMRNVSEAIGLPAQILSDGGSNIKKGVNDFVEENKATATIRTTYDVTHKAALILKHHLRDDDEWKSFVKLTAQTKRNLVHTPLAYLAPPKPKEKARWLNLEMYIDWAENILSLTLEDIKENDREKFKSKLDWVKLFKSQILEWRLMLNLLHALKEEVKSRGMSSKTRSSFEHSVSMIKLVSQRVVSIKEEALEYIEEQCLDIDGVYPGCSDIIESVIGKYKKFSEKSPMKEVGKAVLTMPVFTSKVTHLEVKEAMENISDKDLREWLAQNVGKSLFAKRKEAFKLTKIKSTVKKIEEKLKKVANF